MSDEDTAGRSEGVGDGRLKHVRLWTRDGEERDEGEVYLRHADDAFLVSTDAEFPRETTERYPKADLARVDVTQHHSSCFVTTAVAGDGPTLDALRTFRDDALLEAPGGRALVAVYEAVSPPVARTLARHPDAAPTRAVGGLVELCAGLARRRAASDAPAVRTALTVVLVVLYVVGVCAGVAGHLALRAREVLDV